MSYQSMSDLFRGPQRNRMDACVRQQGAIFAADGRPDIAALGRAVVAGSLEDIDAVIAGISTGPNWSDVADDDQALLAACQECWPRIAAARYPAV